MEQWTGSKLGKKYDQGCILSPCLFNLYADYIMQNARLDKTQARIKIARRNINNLRHEDDTTLMAESEEELKSFLMKVKEVSFKPTFSLSSFIKRLFSSSSLSAIRVVPSAYLRLLIFLLAVLIPACTLSSQAFHYWQLRDFIKELM